MLWLVPGDYTAVFVASFAAALLGLAVLGLLVPDLRARAPRAGAGASTTSAVAARAG